MRSLFIIAFTFIVSFAYAQEWQTDLSVAQGIAKKENKVIILVFQGSDWCAPCIKLDKNIWSTEEFKAYAKDHFVMLKADFPRKKKNALPTDQQEKNKVLADKYNKEGFFPHVLVLDADGEILGETGYEKLTPKEYINLLTSFKK